MKRHPMPYRKTLEPQVLVVAAVKDRPLKHISLVLVATGLSLLWVLEMLVHFSG